MSAILKAFRALINALVVTNAVTEGRIRVGYLDQDDTFPAVTFTVVDEIPELNKDLAFGTAPSLLHTTVDVDIWAESYDVAQTIAVDIIGGLHAYTGTSAGVTIDKIVFDAKRDDYDGDIPVWHITQTYKVRIKQ